MDSVEDAAEVTFWLDILNILGFSSMLWLFLGWFFLRSIRLVIICLFNLFLSYRFLYFFLFWNLNLGFDNFQLFVDFLITAEANFLSLSWLHDWSIAILINKKLPLQLSFNMVHPCSNFCPIFFDTSLVLLRAKLSFWLMKKSSFSLYLTSTFTIVGCWTCCFLL